MRLEGDQTSDRAFSATADARNGGTMNARLVVTSGVVVLLIYPIVYYLWRCRGLPEG